METSTASANPYSRSAYNGAINSHSHLQTLKGYHNHTNSMPANLNELGIPNTLHQNSESHSSPVPPQPPLVSCPPAQTIVNGSSTLNASWPVSPPTNGTNGTNGYLSANPPSNNLSHSTGNLQTANGYFANSSNGISTATGPLPPPPIVSNGSAPNLNSNNDNSGLIGKALNAIRYVQVKAAELMGTDSDSSGHNTPTPPSWNAPPFVPQAGVPPPPPYYPPSPAPFAPVLPKQTAPNQYAPPGVQFSPTAPGATPTLQPPLSQTYYPRSQLGYPAAVAQPPSYAASTTAYAPAVPQTHVQPHLAPITTQPAAGPPIANALAPPTTPGSTFGTYCPALPGASHPPQICWSAPASMTTSPVPFAPAGLRQRMLPSMTRTVRPADAPDPRPSPLAVPLLTDPATRTHTPGWNDPPPLASISGAAAAAANASGASTTASSEAIANTPPADANAPLQ